MSGGEQQRTAIARSLISNPTLVLADEPTANLDHRTGETVVRMLRDLCSTLGVTVVASTHDPTVADEASRVVRMKDGQILHWPNGFGRTAMTQELEATHGVARRRDKLMTTELVPEQILPKVMSTFGLTAAYVFIICWITGSSVMATGGWTAIPMWVLGILTFLVPAGMAVVELGNLWPGQGGVYIWATRTMGETWGFIGGYLSWVPVILNAASSPAVVLRSSCWPFMPSWV